MKETKIEIPAGCEVEKIETQDGHVAVVTFKEKERKLPKSWDEFCEMYPIKDGECVINGSCIVTELKPSKEFNFIGFDKTKRHITTVGILPDRATAEAVLALCQLIQLRNAYNGDWVPDWNDNSEKHSIEFCRDEIIKTTYYRCSCSPLYFNTAELLDEFLRNFRDLIEKLKPLYGIKEGGEE